MRPSDAELFAIAKRAYQAFSRLPNVHAVGVGGRERAGRPTGEVVLKVFVTTKVGPRALAENARVPPLFEGVPTDVIEVGEPSLQVATGVPPMTDAEIAAAEKPRERPLRGGTALMGGLRFGTGTLGCFFEVVENPKLVLAATAHHVLFQPRTPEIPDLKAGQPTPDESCTDCCSNLIGKFLWGVYADDSIDVALIQLDPGLEWQATIEEIGLITGSHDLTVAEAASGTYQIRKRGITTRLTGGILQSIGTVGTTGARHYIDGVAVRPNPLTSNPAAPVVFSHAGDSGSAYVNDAGEVVAIHFMGEHKPVATKGWGFGFPIGELTGKFWSARSQTLKLSVAGNPNTVNIVPAASAIAGESQAPTAGRQLQRDLDRSARGRALLQLWLRHSTELNAIVQHQRRAATVWHRQHGPELLRLLALAPYQPTLPLPAELGGRPLREGLELFLEQIERFASRDLRSDLAAHRSFILTLPGRSYEDVLQELGVDRSSREARN
jgi:hypothetical protein